MQAGERWMLSTCVILPRTLDSAATGAASKGRSGRDG